MLFQRKSKTFTYFDSTVVRHKYYRRAKSNFAPLNIHLWVHFIAFEDGFKFNKKHALKYFVSVLMTINFEITSFFYIYITIQKSYQSTLSINKEEIILILAYVFNIYLRILLYMNRKKFSVINCKLMKLYHMISERKLLVMRYRLFLILIIDELINIILFMGESTYISFTANSMYYALKFVFNWSLMTNSLYIYFCLYCYMINKVFSAFTKLLRQKNIEVENSHFVYNEITKVISSVNGIFHTMLFLTFAVLLAWIFVDSYHLIFMKQKTSIEASCHSLYIIMNFLRITLICLYSSSVAKSAAVVKDNILNISPVITPFIIRISNKFIGFTLLDTIVIGKSLVITCIGSLVTYGMLLATFHRD